MDLRQERIDVSMIEHKQDVEDQYNKFRIFVSIFYMISAFIVKDSIPALSFYTVFFVSTFSFFISIWYWAVDSIQINGLWHYMSSYLDILLVLIMIWSFGTHLTFKTDLWAAGFIWVTMTALKLDWKLTLSTGLFWLVSLIFMLIYSISSGYINAGTLMEAHNSSVVSACSIFIRGVVIGLYLYTITKITSELHNLKRKEFEFYFNIEQKD